MANKLTQSRLRKVLKKTSAPQTGWLDVFPAVIGTASGTVSTGVPGIIYVRNFLNGQVLSVYNFVTPNTAGLQVEVGRKVETPGLWQVKGVREAYSVPAGGTVGNASHTHDDLFLPAHRNLRFLVLPINGGAFTVQIYGDVFRNASGVVTSIINQQLDLSSYVPATGAKWVVIHANGFGTVSVNEGSEVESKELLTLTDITDPVDGYVESCAVRLYAGQAQLYRDPNSINDFVDLRGLRTNGVSLSLDELLDVSASGANDGDVLTYDAFYDMWIAAAPTGGGGAVDSVNGQTGTVVLDYSDIGVREKLTANRTYYVRTDGNDSNNGLTNSSGGAFLTIQKAIDVASALDNGGYNVTIQVGDGTYTGTNVLKTFLGSGTLIIQGNNSTPANVLINVTGNNCFTGTSVIGAYQILDMKLKTTTTGHCIVGNGTGTQISFGNLIFDVVGSSTYSHVFSQRGAWIRAISSYSIIGCGGIHLQAVAEGIVETNVITVTLTGTPAFTTYAECLSNSIIRVVGVTFSGSATGKRYNVNSGVIEATSSETYLPGDTLGTKLNGGVYGSFTGQSRVSTQFDKTNTTLANITGLTATLLAGRTYKFRATLYTTSNVASGVKFAIAGTATATAIIYEALVFNGAAISAQTRATALGTVVGGVTAVTAAYCEITGTITVNAAGTLTVQFADNAGTNTSSVLVGSEFIVEDIT